MRPRDVAGVTLGLIYAAASGAAQPLDEFATCMDTQVAYYERDYPSISDHPDAEFETGNFDWVAYCGMLGIVTCDLSDAPLDCQRALRATQDGMRDKVLAGLPDPSAVEGRGGQWSDVLYPRALALARGTSAGQDCAGSGAAIEVWCEARESSGRLGLAVLSWQIARYLGAAKPAIAAGWASPPPPLRPRGRPKGKTQ